MPKKSRLYFPHVQNTFYIYRGLFNKNLSFKSYIDYHSTNKFQMHFINSNSEFVNIYEYDSNGVKLSNNLTNINYINNFLDISPNINNYIIKEPIVNGTTWSLSNGSIRSITSIDTTIKTKYKLFSSALEITTISNENNISLDYYVENIGLVKSIYYVKNVGLLEYELEDIIYDSFITKKVKFFYPDKNLNSIWFLEKDIEFQTNDIIALHFCREFEKNYKGLIPVINKNINITSLYYDFDKDIVYIDFSNEFLSILVESLKKSILLISSIYETLKNYYNTNNIVITINNKNYKFLSSISSHLKNYFNNENMPLQWRVSDCKLPFTYVVKSNETLLDISRKFDVSHEKLIKLNNIKNPNTIYKNQVLQIYSCGIYTVKPNDTLESICNDFGLCYDDIISINNISDIHLIKAGIKLKLY